MLRKTLLIGVAAIMTSTGTTAFANEEEKSPPQIEAKTSADSKPERPVNVRSAVMFWLLDRNNDGKIDQSEIDDLRAVVFDTVDANSDGSITADEFAAMMPRTPRHGGPHAKGPSRYHKWSKSENHRHHAERRHGPRHEQRGWQRGSRDGQGRDGTKQTRRDNFAERRAERVMDRKGIDREQGLTREAFLENEPRAFGRLDRNDDGVLTLEEMRNGRLLERLIGLN